MSADDYLLNSFNPRELIARIRVVLRRYGKGTSAPIIPDGNDQNIALGELVVDRINNIVSRRGGDGVPLTDAEYRLLDFFPDRPGQIIPRVDLLAEIGSDLTRYMDRTIGVLISRLCRKIEETGLSLFIFRHGGASASALPCRLGGKDKIGDLFRSFRSFRANGLRLGRSNRQFDQRIADSIGRVTARNAAFLKVLYLPDVSLEAASFVDWLQQGRFAEAAQRIDLRHNHRGHCELVSSEDRFWICGLANCPTMGACGFRLTSLSVA